MKNIFILLFSLCSLGLVFGQSDPEAKKILDDLSAATASAENIELYFTYTFENTEQNIPKSEEKGYLLLQGENYFIDLLGMEQFSDGSKIYRVLHDDETVEVMSVDLEEEDGLSPSRILNMYEEGFKFRMMKSEQIGGKSIQWIRLIPDNPNAVPYTHVDLAVNVKESQIHSLVEQGKNGTLTTYLITKFNSNISLKGNEFSYSAEHYPDYDLVDLDF